MPFFCDNIKCDIQNGRRNSILITDVFPYFGPYLRTGIETKCQAQSND